MNAPGFTRGDWDRLATLFHGVRDLRPGVPVSYASYSGYKPGTVEAPNGDTKPCGACGGQGYGRPMGGDCCSRCNGTGRVPNVDARKRYLHVADKYTDAPAWARAYQDRAYAHAARVAGALGVPAAYFPRPEFGALRVLEYPAGAGSVEHTDADLFTILCWRETPGDLERVTRHHDAWGRFVDAEALSPGLHIGRLGELVGLGPATPHHVPARPYVQRSIVYFAIPDHAARLPCEAGYSGALLDAHRAIIEVNRPHAHPPCGPTVGEWLKKEMPKMRYT